jgi:apolipoprotein N-acyltransferase
MAKKTEIHTGLWVAIASVLVAAAWLMKSFPVLIFIAYAPLLVIADRADSKKPAWEHFEWVLIPLTISFLSVFWLDTGKIYLAFVQGIMATLVFILFNFSKEVLGPRLGMVTLILYWLAMEYLLLLLPWRDHFVFMADALQLWPAWTTWTMDTGYLGITAWILVCNFLIYLAWNQNDRIQITWLVLALLLIGIPIAWSYYQPLENITRADMINWYSEIRVPSEVYQQRGEFVVRTAAWVSVLIVLVSMVRNKVRKK